MFKKKYWLIIGIYIIMQILSVAIPTFLHFVLGYDFTTAALTVNVIVFIIAAILSLWIMRADIHEENITHPMSIGRTIGWVALGLFLAWTAEIIAASFLLYGLGIGEGSANTDVIVEMARMNPIFILIPAIAGPILEELIFRKIIFGWLNEKSNFFIAAVVSSLLFGLAHMEMQLLLVYVVMGFVFAYIYWKTKRIIIPMLVHMSLNSVAVIGQLLFDPEKLQQIQDELTLIHFFH